MRAALGDRCLGVEVGFLQCVSGLDAFHASMAQKSSSESDLNIARLIRLTNSLLVQDLVPSILANRL